MKKQERPDCYKCEYRGDLPGDAHSRCLHPETKEAIKSDMGIILAIFAAVGRATPVMAKTKLNIVGHPHGIRRGWFNWPWNFDPVWLESCDGFKKKREE